MSDDSAADLLQMGLGFWSAKALLTAVELGVFGVLAQSPHSAPELSAALELNGRGVRDFLDVLTSLGLLVRDGERYANAPRAATHLVPGLPGYIGGALEMSNARLYPVWAKLSEALRSGEPQNEAKQEEAQYYHQMQREQERLRSFLRGMTGLSMAAALAIAEKFPWRERLTFCDVGGAQGGLAATLVQRHPHLSGSVLELPSVQPFFDEYVQPFGFGERLRFQGADFFQDPLPRADVLIMGHVLHNWDLERKRLLIRKAFEALPPGGVLLVYEALLDDERRQATFGLLMSLNMLLVTSGGFVFSGQDCRGWMQEAGFGEVRVDHLSGPDWMVIATKPA